MAPPTPLRLIAEATVFGGGLGAMAWLTESLPVALVPEQIHITPMRDDVVDQDRWCCLALALALFTEWVRLPVSLAGLLPVVVVTPRMR